jgi:hypothetical protein
LLISAWDAAGVGEGDAEKRSSAVRMEDAAAFHGLKCIPDRVERLLDLGRSTRAAEGRAQLGLDDDVAIRGFGAKRALSWTDG